MKALRAYKSSAGSGKTFTLVLEYLLLVVKNPAAFRNVLAVTFTNKAANELKERILEALFQLAENKQESAIQTVVLPKLIERTGLDETEIRTRAAFVFHQMLHHYSDFNVSTIDSFVQRLSRTFARELQLPSRYEVLTESDAMIDLAKDLIIEQVGVDPFLTSLILNFVQQKLDDEDDWRFEKKLLSFMQLLLQEDAFRFRHGNSLDSLNQVQEVRKHLRGFTQKLENEVLKLALEFENLLEKYDLSINDLAGGAKGMAVFFKRIQNLDFAGAMDSKHGKNPPLSGKWAAGKLTKSQKDTVSSIENELDRIFNAIREKLIADLPQYSLYRLLDAEILSFALQQRLLDQMDELSAQSNQVHISEFNKRLATAIDDASVPYIYERLGERYKHFLLDEFQDTSLLQWHNFLPLIENGLATNNLSLLVGDAKQAIYRFRSGEVEQFIQLPEIYRKEESLVAMRAEPSIKQHYEAFNLDTNYRSLSAVVSFNNSFFRFMAEQLSENYRSVYHDVEQKFIPRDAEGLVQLEFLDAVNDDLEFGDVFQQRSQEIINDLRARHYAYRDIVILVRSRADGAEMARFLSLQQIPVISSESLLVRSSAAVQLLVHTLQFIHQPDDVVVSSGLRYYHQQATLKEVEKMCPSADFFIDEKILPNKMEALLGLDLGSLDRAKVAAYSLYDFCEYLIRLYGLNKQADAYLPFFLEAVYTWQSGTTAGLDDFLAFWEEQSSKISVINPEDTDAVKIMTIHKAKGLEFPVVIYPYAANAFRANKTKSHAWVSLENEGIPGLKQGVIKLNADLKTTSFADLYEEEIEKSRLDTVNIIYVAATRAVEQLFVLTKKTSKSNGFYEKFLQEKGLWQEGEQLYTFGSSKDLPRYPSVSESATKQYPAMVSGDWSKRMLVAPEAGHYANTTAVHWGRLVHEIMAGLRYSDELPQILEKSFNNGLLEEKDLMPLQQLLEAVMLDSRLIQAFNKPAVILNEAEMISKTGQIFRPDRVAILPEKLILIDYKTGDADESHQQQILGYSTLIQQLEQKPVEAYLVYLNQSPEIIPC
ncbi:MAG: UvrD-helicase domain-containing protein [Bacteroidetes bacterium]|nr:UvrD-helicase domain-containing protein [Bacteroidota bacterium]